MAKVVTRVFTGTPAAASDAGLTRAVMEFVRAWTSTAAGAYQFLARVWDETARIMGLGDFSPGNQDLAAVGRIAARGALPDVLAGRFESAVRKCAWEWASLPGSPYGQPTISMERAKAIYLERRGADGE